MAMHAAPATVHLPVTPPPGGAAVVPRRLQGKQPPPTHQSHVFASAMAAECADDGLQTLGQTVKRKHVHWTHARTFNSNQRQPSFARKQFWEHMVQCYRLAYPTVGSPTGSILMFGSVAKERHARAWAHSHRDEHHHCPVYCSVQHYWCKVARNSRDRFGVQLNAVAHSGYTEMWRYIREPSHKKPLAELDAEVYLSPLHPRGIDLTQLLAEGDQSLACFKRCPSSLATVGRHSKRPRVDSVYDLILTHNIRSIHDFEAHAHKEAEAGRKEVAELYTRQGHKMQQMIINATFHFSRLEEMKKYSSA